MKWDRFMYLVESNSTERYQLLLAGIQIHLRKTTKPEHYALCNRNIRTFITKDINQVTCDKCKEVASNG